MSVEHRVDLVVPSGVADEDLQQALDLAMDGLVELSPLGLDVYFSGTGDRLTISFVSDTWDEGPR